MRFRYLIYPEAKKKLESLNLGRRVKDAKQNDTLPFLGGSLSGSEIHSVVEDLKERGYYKTLPKQEKKDFQEGINNLFQNIDSFKWKVERKGKTLEEETDLHDIMLMSGYPSSFVLTPNEIWDYKKYGFDSLAGFIGATGATVWEFSHDRNLFERGYKWGFEDPEGRFWENDVTGDINYDLKIYKTDITPDKTFDPVGNKVEYRPEIDDDHRGVSAFHSTEISLLVSLIKYVEQIGLESKVLRNGGKEIISQTLSQRQKGGATTEHLCPNETHMTTEFLSFDFPIPVLDKDYQTDKWSCDRVVVPYGEFSYGIYVGPNKELIFSLEKDGREIKKNPSVVFQKEEADYLIKGLFHQAINGLGRTPAVQLAQAVHYRYSGEYEKDLKRFRDFKHKNL